MANPTLDSISEGALRSVLATGARPQNAGPLSAAVTHGWRALLKIKHVPEQLIDVTMFPIMMTLMFTYLFGGALAGSPGDYLQFLLPGILVTTVVMITMYTGIGVNNDVSKGIFDRLRSLPVWQASAIVGALLGDTVRYTLACSIVLVLGLIMGYRPEGGPIGVVLAIGLILLFAFSLSWLWTTLGLVLRSEKSVMNMAMMIMFPLSFVSNVFVDPATMPSWLRSFVDVNPITHLVTAVRGLMAGSGSMGDISLVFLSCAVFTAIFAPLTMHLYRNKK